jgi:hypothetical protein
VAVLRTATEIAPAGSRRSIAASRRVTTSRTVGVSGGGVREVTAEVTGTGVLIGAGVDGPLGPLGPLASGRTEWQPASSPIAAAHATTRRRRCLAPVMLLLSHQGDVTNRDPVAASLGTVAP